MFVSDKLYRPVLIVEIGDGQETQVVVLKQMNSFVVGTASCSVTSSSPQELEPARHLSPHLLWRCLPPESSHHRTKPSPTKISLSRQDAWKVDGIWIYFRRRGSTKCRRSLRISSFAEGRPLVLYFVWLHLDDNLSTGLGEVISVGNAIVSEKSIRSRCPWRTTSP